MAIWKIYSWNVNGIRAAEKKGFLEWLKSSGADIVAVQETKAEPIQLSEALLKPNGYTTAWASSRIKKGHAGVGTFSKTPPNTVIVGMDDERFDGDGRVLITEYEPFVLFNIYFPNGGRGPEWVEYKLAFYRHWLSLVAAYQAKGRPVVTVGDVNTAYAEIDLARPKENAKNTGFLPIERAAMEEFWAAGLIDTYRHFHPDEVRYSWWDQKSGARERNVGWRIDYGLITADLLPYLKAADIYSDIMGSDHCPISLELDFN
jgi:exodeoxyribonuclease-3